MLHGFEGVVVVADDILIYGKGTSGAEAYRNHDEALLQLLKRARECNIKLNRNKMRLRMSELLHIGYQISEKGIRPDPAKVMAVKGMAAPKSATDVQRFLGMCNYMYSSGQKKHYVLFS